MEHRVENHSAYGVADARGRELDHVRRNADRDAGEQASDSRPVHAARERNGRDADCKREIEPEQHGQPEQDARAERPAAGAALAAVLDGPSASGETGREAEHAEADATDPRERGKAEGDDDQRRGDRAADRDGPSPTARERIDTEHDRDLLSETEHALR